MPQLRRVKAFVDWDTARRLLPVKAGSVVRQIESAILALQSGVADHLIRTQSRDFYFRVSWRIYHGWHSGRSKTQDRRDFDQYLLMARDRTIRNVSFAAEFRFGDMPDCDSPRAPLFDTLRVDRDGVRKQKMVDTSLACDVLYSIRSKMADFFLLIANDDDFVPVLFTAEKWNPNIKLLHTRDDLNPHLNLKHLVSKMVIT